MNPCSFNNNCNSSEIPRYLYIFIVILFRHVAICQHVNFFKLAETLTHVRIAFNHYGNDKVMTDLKKHVKDDYESNCRLFPGYEDRLTVEAFENWLNGLLNKYHEICGYIGKYQLSGRHENQPLIGIEFKQGEFDLT